MLNQDLMKNKLMKLNVLLTYSMLIKEDQLILKVQFFPNLELKAAMTSLGFESKSNTIFQMIADLDADGSGQL